ncbi:hypothetical protein ECDEC12A_5534 [Escherichia coli DEC12A]|nr:hypothetical protein ECDEC12A_5534 [Escherichia coli DEC12A]
MLEQGSSLLMMDLSKKDCVEDAYKVKEKLIVVLTIKAAIRDCRNNHFAVIT